MSGCCKSYPQHWRQVSASFGSWFEWWKKTLLLLVSLAYGTWSHLVTITPHHIQNGQKFPAPCTPHYLRSAVDLYRRRSSNIIVSVLIVSWFCLIIEFRLPHPNECQLYYVNRDTLFSYHKASEVFLQVIVNVFLLYQPFFGVKHVSIYRTLCRFWVAHYFIANLVQWVVVFHTVWWLFMYTFMLLILAYNFDGCREWWHYMLRRTTRTHPMICNSCLMLQLTIFLCCLVS